MANNVQNPLELNPTVGGKQYAAGISKTKMQSLVDEVNKVGDKYEKPAGGIPSSDLSSAVQGSLQRADESVSEGNFQDEIFALYNYYGDSRRLNQLADWGSIDNEETLRSRLRNVSNLSQAHTQRISFTVGGKTGFAIVTYNGEEFYVEYTLGSNRYACKQDSNQSGGWTPWLGSTELETYEHLDDLDTRCDKQEDDIRAESNRAKEAEELLDERKADVEGSYESMAVGSAKTLEADTLTAVDFTKRVVPSSVGSGASKLSLLKGNTLVWNQMVNLTKINIAPKTVAGLTISATDGYIHIVGTATTNTATNLANLSIELPIVSTHKYYFKMMGSNKKIIRFYFGSGKYFPYADSALMAGIQTGQIDVSQTIAIYIRPNINDTYDDYFYPQIIDLTLMFGKGNEPSSVEEFEALFPRENYAYSSPWLMNFQGTGLKSTGSDFEQTLPLNVTTLKGKAEGSDTEVVMFPNGLKKAGSVYDEIDYKNGIAIKRVGSVDLGTLGWTYVANATNPYFRVVLQDISQTPKDKMNYICAKYNSISPIKSEEMDANTSDKIVARRFLSAGSNFMYIRDSAYSDVVTFKAAMQGVMLYYELATPIVYHFEPMNNVYRVEQGGTEEVENRDSISPEGYSPLTAPMRADIRYGVDVVGILGNLKKDYVSKESIQVFLSALGTQMGGTWSMTWNETAGRYDFVFTPNA